MPTRTTGQTAMTCTLTNISSGAAAGEMLICNLTEQDNMNTTDFDAGYYGEGIRAYLSGVSYDDCPYEADSHEAFNWTEGWLRGDWEG